MLWPLRFSIIGSVIEEKNIQQFWHEARLHMAMRHPHIVRVLDFGMKGKVPFFVMDYAPLGTLPNYTHSPVPLSAILPAVTQISDALQYIHEHSLIHRDVKPSNLLINADHDIWLSDFGIAVNIPLYNSCSDQESLGTAIYAAPEQICGRSCPASDQYSLAVLVYSWLCAHPPFSGNAAQLCQQHLYSAPPHLFSNNPSLSSQIDYVVLKALSKDPSQRYPHMLDFSSALHQAYLSTSLK